jgi:hypothetical protein
MINYVLLWTVLKKPGPQSIQKIGGIEDEPFLLISVGYSGIRPKNYTKSVR